MSKDKKVTMYVMELDLDEKVVKELCDYALEAIKNDIPELVNYAVNKILAQKMLEESPKKVAKKKSSKKSK